MPARAEQRLTAEYVSARALAESATLAEAAVRVLQALCEALGWDYGALWNVDADSGVLHCVETWHLPTLTLPQFEAASRGTTFTRGVGLPGRVWASGEPAWVPDVVADANFPRAAVAGAGRAAWRIRAAAADSRDGRRRHGILQSRDP